MRVRQTQTYLRICSCATQVSFSTKPLAPTARSGWRMQKFALQTHVSFVNRQVLYKTLNNLAIQAMDTDKIKVFGARIKVDSTGKLAELERAEKV